MTEATGLTKGSIYGNFADKDEVAMAAFAYNSSLMGVAVRTEMAKRSSFREKLMVYVELYGNFDAVGPSLEGGCPILNTLTEADDTHPQLKAKAVEALTAWKERLTSLIRDGIKAGEFKADLDAEETAVTMIALLEGIVLFVKATGKQTHRKFLVNALTKLIRSL
jgi:AcrR family transcriptional regulator